MIRLHTNNKFSIVMQINLTDIGFKKIPKILGIVYYYIANAILNDFVNNKKHLGNMKKEGIFNFLNDDNDSPEDTVLNFIYDHVNGMEISIVNMHLTDCKTHNPDKLNFPFVMDNLYFYDNDGMITDISLRSVKNTLLCNNFHITNDKLRSTITELAINKCPESVRAFNKLEKLSISSPLHSAFVFFFNPIKSLTHLAIQYDSLFAYHVLPNLICLKIYKSSSFSNDSKLRLTAPSILNLTNNIHLKYLEIEKDRVYDIRLSDKIYLDIFIYYNFVFNPESIRTKKLITDFLGNFENWMNTSHFEFITNEPNAPMLVLPNSCEHASINGTKIK